MRAAAVRLTLGTTMLVSPTLGRKIFGVPANQDNSAVRLLARMWGIRQVVLGAWALQVQSRPKEDRKLCYQLNAVTDVVDVVALGLAGFFGTGMLQASVMGAAAGINETLAWVDLLDQLDDDSADQESVSLA